jgi:hypothetical protein
MASVIRSAWCTWRAGHTVSHSMRLALVDAKATRLLRRVHANRN